MWKATQENTDASCLKKLELGGIDFVRANVVNPWNELDEKTVSADTVEKLKRKLSEYEY